MLLGRTKQQKLLLSLLDSEESEFVAVYGRRVGKTFSRCCIVILSAMES